MTRPFAFAEPVLCSCPLRCHHSLMLPFPWVLGVGCLLVLRCRVVLLGCELLCRCPWNSAQRRVPEPPHPPRVLEEPCRAAVGPRHRGARGAHRSGRVRPGRGRVALSVPLCPRESGGRPPATTAVVAAPTRAPLLQTGGACCGVTHCGHRAVPQQVPTAGACANASRVDEATRTVRVSPAPMFVWETVESDFV